MKITQLETRGFASGLLELRKGSVNKTPDFENWKISQIIWSRLLREFVLLGLAEEIYVSGRETKYTITPKGKIIADLLYQIEQEFTK